MKKSLSIVAISILILTGCGSSGKSDNKSSSFVTKNNKSANLQELQKIGEKKSIQSSLKIVKSTATDVYSKNSSDITLENDNICDSGSLDIKNDKDMLYSFDANNCSKDGSTIDGKIDISVDEKNKKGSIDVKRDFRLNDEGHTLFISKGSKIVANDKTISADFKTKMDDKTIAAQNLSLSYQTDDNGGTFSFTSGALNIDDYYFEFVKQETPFKIDENGLSDGKLLLKDGAGHKVEISAKSDMLYLGIDENGDGNIEESEKVSFDELNL